ncbi:hypothetical protein AAZX31_04G040300 [Glycine max]|uniref:Uncharacterized protein n=2 Tax=Glycine subgen. Soja TaxID=1462606 RepID=A0A0R0K3L1_SOYBN|nr:hypothetical protein JHK85_009271 [Glycine max]KAG5065290.1 hypothetical protein JHK86_009021 [Glycine max]KAH1109690.1 hypothetical protein GYH30_008878 [Glycine max]RZC14934.1 hypothetical protein D0Y65_008721 [Glycine soja]
MDYYKSKIRKNLALWSRLSLMQRLTPPRGSPTFAAAAHRVRLLLPSRRTLLRSRRISVSLEICPFPNYTSSENDPPAPSRSSTDRPCATKRHRRKESHRSPNLRRSQS